MTDLPLTILYLYPDEMNFYGDSGNVLALQRRLQWRGYKVDVVSHHIGDTLPDKVDIVVGGGGQDKGQFKIHADLLRIGNYLHKLADNNVPMLMVCGLYQLFGHQFVTSNKQTLPGIGIFDLETVGSNKRMIGNIITETEFGELIGFENHSGQTILSDKQTPLGKTIVGYGNNETSKTEGAMYKKVYGTYLHGPLLPKNPVFADSLIQQALINRGENAEDLIRLDDNLVPKLHQDAHNR
jgi:CobQ-like glutamine amidotransferase family enzyme